MKIKEYKLISKEKNGTFPQLKCVVEHDYIYDEMFLYFNHNNYEFEYLFFGDVLELQNNYTEHCYVLSYDGNNNPIGIFLVSSGAKNKNTIYIDNILTFLLLSGSKSFILVHNHPNNISEKSIEDIEVDNLIKEMSRLLNIEYKEGLIITKYIIENIHQKADNFEKKYFNNPEGE